MARSSGTGGMTAGAATLASTPRSGARPLFGGQPSSPPRSSSSQPRTAARPSAPRSPSAGPRSSGGRSTGRAATARPAAGPARTRGQRGRAGARGPAGTRRRQSSPVTQARRYTRAANQLTSPNLRNYQGIILAEFVLAELLVAATPIAARQNVPGLSPYVPRDMTKLLAIGLLYFILSLVSVAGQGPGRLSAWLGGLVLLTVGLNEGANVARDLDIFSPAKRAKPEPVQEA